MANFYLLKSSILAICLLGVLAKQNENNAKPVNDEHGEAQGNPNNQTGNHGAGKNECAGNSRPEGIQLCREGRGVCVYRYDKYGNEGHKACVGYCGDTLPEGPENSEIILPVEFDPTAEDNWTNMMEGASFEFACDDGYVPTCSYTDVVCLPSGNWSEPAFECKKDCASEYLVNGANPVSDSQLSASSYWCGSSCLAAHYARLNATGSTTGAWAPSQLDVNQWIQVDFIDPMKILAIVLTGRYSNAQYVTSFEVSVSRFCVRWEKISDGTGSPKVFEGTSGSEVTVTRDLPELVVARCVRVQPVTWVNYIALRFDVLGCAF